jgi:hypothetical protein
VIIDSVNFRYDSENAITFIFLSNLLLFFQKVTKIILFSNICKFYFLMVDEHLHHIQTPFHYRILAQKFRLRKSRSYRRLSLFSPGICLVWPTSANDSEYIQRASDFNDGWILYCFGYVLLYTIHSSENQRKPFARLWNLSSTGKAHRWLNCVNAMKIFRVFTNTSERPLNFAKEPPI